MPYLFWLYDLGFRIIYRQYNTSSLGENVPILFSIFWVVILCSVSFLLPRLAKRIYLIATSFIFAFFALVHAFFVSFFGTYMSFSSFIFAGEGAAFFDWSYFTIPKKYVFILAVAFFLAIISALIIPKTKYSPVRVICPIVAVILGIVGINMTKNTYLSEDGEFRWNSTQSIAEVYDSFSDVNLCMHMAGLYQYTFRDLGIVTGFSDVLESISQSDTIAELDRYYENKEIDPDNEMTGIFKDKNLILIQLESIDTWMINDVSMPALAAIQRESIDFTEFYAPKYLKAPHSIPRSSSTRVSPHR